MAYGAGDGTFPDVRPLPMAGQLADLVAVKLDSDDLMDLVISNGQSSVGTIKNLGSRVFGQMRFYNVGSGSSALGAADFDDDGDQDIVVAKENDQSLSFMENRGNGLLLQQIVNHLLEGRPGRLATGDMDLNGLPDVVVTLPEIRRIAIVLDIGNWIFSPPVRFVSAMEPLTVGIGDFNEDLVPDMVTLDRSLDLALMMLNIEPNPVPVERPALSSSCHASAVELRCEAPAPQPWRLEGRTGSGWILLAEGSVAVYGLLEGQAGSWRLHLTAADIARAGLLIDASGTLAFRLVSPVSGETLASSVVASACLDGSTVVDLPLISVDVPHPNPFNPAVSVRFTLAESAWVRSAVWDLTGRKVADLAVRRYPAGEHRLQWDGLGTDGPVSAGAYFLTVETAGRIFSHKVTLLK
jgi:hypothetical protein